MSHANARLTPAGRRILVRRIETDQRCDLGHRTKLSIESRGGATGGARLNRRSAPSAAQPTTINQRTRFRSRH
jgi:hypothetical protein